MIKKNIKITLPDSSEQGFIPGVHLTSTEDGSIILDALSNRVSLDPKDLKEALEILEDFTKKNAPIEAVKSAAVIEFG